MEVTEQAEVVIQSVINKRRKELELHVIKKVTNNSFVIHSQGSSNPHHINEYNI